MIDLCIFSQQSFDFIYQGLCEKAVTLCFVNGHSFTTRGQLNLPSKDRMNLVKMSPLFRLIELLTKQGCMVTQWLALPPQE